jgi:hypothetical protein
MQDKREPGAAASANSPRTMRTADILSWQLQMSNGGLLQDVGSAQKFTPDEIWCGFTVTDNDGANYVVYVTPAPPGEAGAITGFPGDAESAPADGQGAGERGRDAAAPP